MLHVTPDSIDFLPCEDSEIHFVDAPAVEIAEAPETAEVAEASNALSMGSRAEVRFRTEPVRPVPKTG